MPGESGEWLGRKSRSPLFRSLFISLLGKALIILQLSRFFDLVGRRRVRRETPPLLSGPSLQVRLGIPHLWGPENRQIRPQLKSVCMQRQLLVFKTLSAVVTVRYAVSLHSGCERRLQPRQT